MSPTIDPAFLDAIEEKVIDEWSGSVWRVVLESSDPLRPNRRGARWNPADVEALYCSLQIETAHTEIEHLFTTQPVRITRARVAHELQIQLSRVVDLRDVEALAPFGFKREDLLGEDYELAQRVGAAIAWLGCSAAIVPSARHEGYNLIVFTDNMDKRDSVEVVRSIDLD